MRILFKFLLIFLLIIIGIYSISWYFVLNAITSELNSKYSRQDINIGQSAGKSPYFMKFSNISKYGYPFKFAFRIDEVVEENDNSRSEYKDPIYLGYDLLKQRFFVDYHGETISWYKPLYSKFGSKIKSDTQAYANVPSTYNLIKFLFHTQRDTKEDSISLLNFIHTIEFHSKNLEIFDLVDNQKLYEQEYNNTIIELTKHRDYLNVEELLNDIPQSLKITGETKVVYASGIEKRVSPVNILYNLYLPFIWSGQFTLNAKTTSKTLATLADNLEINMDSYFTSNKVENVKTDLFYRGTKEANNHNINFKAKSEFTLKKGLIDEVFYTTRYLNDLTQNHMLGRVVAGDVKYILDNKDKLSLKKLEEKKYEIDLDLSVNAGIEQVSLKINDLSLLAGGRTGLKVVGQCEANNTMQRSVDNNSLILKGDAVVYNYRHLAYFILENAFALNKYTNVTDAEGKFRLEVIVDFLKNISDHPNSAANDISYAYDINFKDLNNSKFGSTVVSRIMQLYRVSFFKTLATTIAQSDNIDQKINELAPSLSETEKEFLKKLITHPQDIKPESWGRILQN